MACSKPVIFLIALVVVLFIVAPMIVIWHVVTHRHQPAEQLELKNDTDGISATLEIPTFDTTQDLFMIAGSGDETTKTTKENGEKSTNAIPESSGSSDKTAELFFSGETEIDQSFSILTGPDTHRAKIEKAPWLDSRLPKYFLPLHYEVDLKPVLMPDSSGVHWFYGRSKVTFEVTRNTSAVLIHSNKLNISTVKLSMEKSSPIAIERYWLYEPNEYLIINLITPLQAQSFYTLETTFSGELKHDMTGLFYSEYTTKSGEIKYASKIAASQMEVYYARETFPCFDEPELKATFDISLRHEASYYALSNMNVKITETMSNGWLRTLFSTSPRMSTYLVALVVCDFDFISANTTTDPAIQTRIIAQPRQIKAGNADYANRISPKILDYYAKYFDVAYSLPKADNIAVPGFDVATAMENWGLVIYGEIFLLFSDSTTSVSSKQEVARVVAHELSHQWFGNIISPLWWNELWLNEGFASFIQYLGVDHVEPSWQMNNQFVVKDFRRAMSVDGLVSSRPIVARNVSTKKDIDALFDAISYSKGACIIRMIRAFAGDEAFRSGLKNYITENQYGSVTHQQLFNYWEQAINETKTGSIPPGGFTKAMNTWVLQMGFPIVTLKRHPLNPNKVFAVQERFLLNSYSDPQKPETPFGYSWVIPFWYATEGNLDKNLTWLLPGAVLEISVPENEFIIGNYEVFGFYRVNYDEKNWRQIISQLNKDFKVIEPKTRGQLIDDAFNLARADRLSYEVPLNLSLVLLQDFNYIPWKSAMDGFLYLDKMLARSKTYERYTNYLRNILSPSVKEFEWKILNDHLQILQQTLVLNKACSIGEKRCQKHANRFFVEWKKSGSKNKKPINPDFRSVVYCQAMSQGGKEEWNFLWQRYLNEIDPHEKFTLLQALACVKNEELVQRFLDYTKNGSYIRSQDGPLVLINLCNNNGARDIVWSFLKTEWDFVLEAYGSALFSFRKIIRACTSSFSTEKELNELEMFMNDNADNVGYARQTFEQAAEQVKANIRWRQTNEQFLHDWLQNVQF